MTGAPSTNAGKIPLSMEAPNCKPLVFGPVLPRPRRESLTISLFEAWKTSPLPKGLPLTGALLDRVADQVDEPRCRLPLHRERVRLNSVLRHYIMELIQRKDR